MDPKQEFQALARRAKELGGWTQVEIARRLGVERATINGIVTGTKPVGEPLLRLFRREFFDAFPQAQTTGVKYPAQEESAVGMDSPDVRRAHGELREIHEADVATFETVQRVISLAHHSVKRPKKKVVNSTAGAVGKDAGDTPRARRALRKIVRAAVRSSQAGSAARQSKASPAAIDHEPPAPTPDPK